MTNLEIFLTAVVAVQAYAIWLLAHSEARWERAFFEKDAELARSEEILRLVTAQTPDAENFLKLSGEARELRQGLRIAVVSLVASDTHPMITDRLQSLLGGEKAAPVGQAVVELVEQYGGWRCRGGYVKLHVNELGDILAAACLEVRHAA